MSSDIRIDPHNDTNIDPPPKGKRWPFGLIDRAMDSSDAINDPMLRSTIEVCSLFCKDIYRCVNGNIDFLQARKSFVAVIDLIGSSFGG